MYRNREKKKLVSLEQNDQEKTKGYSLLIVQKKYEMALFKYVLCILEMNFNFAIVEKQTFIVKRESRGEVM